MNPRAVQSERPNESTPNCDFHNFGARRNATVSVENYFNRHSTGHVPKAQSKSVQTQCCFMDEHFMELDDMKFFTSINKPWRMNKELPSVDNNAVQSLLDLERKVFDKVDDGKKTRSHKHKKLKSDQSSNTFTDIFNDPGILSKRTKITPTGLKIAQLSDSTSDWRRCFDQVHLAEARYSAFGWWLCAIWTLKSGCNGVCYSNGTYFLAILINSAYLINVLSSFFHLQSQTCQKKHIYENSVKVEEKDVFAAVRVGNMLLMISSIMELVHMTGDNILLNDALQYMQLDTFGVYDK
uniref:Uncharacterized protein n=1 Tax=Ditylenchus dipsaci TaxID=166011 RepID=A0A915DMF6_9BILA